MSRIQQSMMIDTRSKHPSSWGQNQSLGVPRLSFGINTKYTSVFGNSSKGRGGNVANNKAIAASE